MVKWEQSASGQPGPTTLGTALWERLHGNESDATLSGAVSDAIGYSADVATFTGSFECRKLQVVIGFTPPSAPVEDARITTFHFLRLVSGSPSDTWVEENFTAVETAWDTYWSAWRAHLRGSYSLKQYRWYKAGPGVTGAQEPVRVVDRDLIGLNDVTGNKTLPPQVAVATTEKTSSRKAWGRFYMPAPASAQIAQHTGRLETSFLTDVGNAADTLYEAVKAAGTPVVVYSPAKPARPKKPSGTLPATVARALTVDDIQVDDVPDIIRSRRHATALLKVQRAIS